jgi:hypothetical protein
MGRTCDILGEMRNACRMLVNESEQKMPFERHRHRQEYNTKMNLK